MDRQPPSPRNVIHVPLERLGYTGEVVQAIRIWPGSIAGYREWSETVTISGSVGFVAVVRKHHAESASAAK